MSDIAEYILAKQTLAELDVCPFGNNLMTAVDIIGENRVYRNWGDASTFALPDLRGSAVMLSGVRSIGYAEQCSMFLEDLVAIFNSQSDSQQFSRRAHRARDIRAVNLQAQVPLTRVYDFEKPFSEETFYSPRIPETPRILKLRK
jgi:hypothetical protein